MRTRAALLCLLLTWVLGPRAALADAFRTDRDALVHWTIDDVDVRVDAALREHFGPEFMPMLEQAADTWSVSPGVPILHIAAAAADEHDVEQDEKQVWLGFGRPDQFKGELAITVSTTRALSGDIMSVRVYVNPAVQFALPADGARATGYDLQGVLTHELGHVLGLDEDEARPRATMNPHFHRGELHQRTLSVSDEDAVSNLYQQFYKADEQSGCSLGHTASPALSWVSLLGIALRLRARARRLRC